MNIFNDIAKPIGQQLQELNEAYYNKAYFDHDHDENCDCETEFNRAFIAFFSADKRSQGVVGDMTLEEANEYAYHDGIINHAQFYDNKVKLDKLTF